MKGRFLFFFFGALPFLFVENAYSFHQKVFYSIQGEQSWPYSLPSGWSAADNKISYGPHQHTGKKYDVDVVLFYTESEACSDWIRISTTSSFSSLGEGTLVSKPARYLTAADVHQELNDSCVQKCPDIDGDGLCDPCDQWPDDPSVGPEWYLKGYLKYNGKIVGTYGSPSKNKPNYDRLSIADEFAEPDGFPGLGMFVGAGGGTSGGFYVDQDIFQKSGGETVFLSEPALMFKTSCAPIDDITQCNNAVCQQDKPSEVDKDDYPLNNSEIPTDEQYIELDKPYYKPIPKPSSNDPVSTDPCPEHRALCTNTCGGTRRVSNFACAGTNANSHVICSCDSTGGYEFSPSFNDIGDTTFSSSTQTGSSTINKYGSGSGKDYDPKSIGSETDDLNQDSDSTNDSYAYKEGQVDFAPVQAAYGRLTGKFPFNLANSFVDVFRPFANAQGSTPTFSYSIAGHVVLFDLSPFNDFARFIRSMFALGLTLSTILALLYIYVGIDFRRK